MAIAKNQTGQDPTSPSYVPPMMGDELRIREAILKTNGGQAENAYITGETLKVLELTTVGMSTEMLNRWKDAFVTALKGVGAADFVIDRMKSSFQEWKEGPPSTDYKLLFEIPGSYLWQMEIDSSPATDLLRNFFENAPPITSPDFAQRAQQTMASVKAWLDFAAKSRIPYAPP